MTDSPSVLEDLLERVVKAEGPDRELGLVPTHPNRKPHPCNDMTREVHVGDGACVTIINPRHEDSAEWHLRYGNPEVVRFTAASVLESYDYLLSGWITTEEAIRRLRILRNARALLATQDPNSKGEG